MLDFVFRTGKNYYLQVLIEGCKYVVKEKRISNISIFDDIESSSESDEENSDRENSDEENLKILI